MGAEGAGESPAVGTTMGAEGAVESPAVEGATICTAHVETSVNTTVSFVISSLRDKRALSANDRARIIAATCADSMSTPKNDLICKCPHNVGQCGGEQG